jgi:hypothetical protein
MDALLSRAQTAWASYAGIDGGFRPGQVSLGVNAQSRICPPGWAGIVILGGAAIVTAPAPGAERELRRALAGVPADRLTGFPGPGPGPGQTGWIVGHGGRAGLRLAAAVAGPGARIDPGRGQPRLRFLRQPAQLPAGRSHLSWADTGRRRAETGSGRAP